ncbi:MAG: hypothetical protein LBT51_06530 [Fusobacteriaceae bacterium]|jgi:hypothetical protein|nr:hypothetical protein [Fusobacteriaceae bacterium]
MGTLIVFIIIAILFIVALVIIVKIIKKIYYFFFEPGDFSEAVSSVKKGAAEIKEEVSKVDWVEVGKQVLTKENLSKATEYMAKTKENLEEKRGRDVCLNCIYFSDSVIPFESKCELGYENTYSNKSSCFEFVNKYN